jgi:mannose-6-phosphate isomerase-like protein (cupin superfamily)
MITLEEFHSFIENDIVYLQNLLYYIDAQGQEHKINNLGHLHSLYGNTIKLEGAEKYNKALFDYCQSFKHSGPVTCHIFRSFAGSHSFPTHVDPDDVHLRLLYGQKTIILEDTEHILNPNDCLYIPANTPHRAINNEESLMLSIGLEKFLIDKL